jgi:hypothetical protein
MTPPNLTEFASGHYPNDYPHKGFIDDADAYEEANRVAA